MSALVLLSLPLSLLAFGAVVTWAVLESAWQAVSPSGLTMERSGSRRASAWLTEASAAIDRLAGERPDSHLTCPASPFIPKVTDVEAQVIAVELKRRGDAEVQRVVEKSRVADGVCPMRLADGLCACATIRPLECLGRCLAGADSPEWAAGLGPSLSTAFRQHLKNHHADSIARGLNEAMLTAFAGEPDHVRN